MTIDWTQPVETDETPPRPVRVLCTDLDNDRGPVIAALYDPAHGCEAVHSFLGSGDHVLGRFAIRNVAPKPVVEMFERWVNLYPNGSSGVIHSRKEDADNTTRGGRRIDCRRIVWNSDGSPVEDDLLAEYKADRDHWKAKAEVLQAEIERQRVAHDDHLNRMMEQVNGANYYRKLSEEKVEALQAEVGSMKPVVDAAVAGVDSFNRRGLLRLIEAVRAYQNQPCPTCDGGMIYLKRTQCHDCNGTGKKVNTR
jgi:hypothetical protein